MSRSRSRSRPRRRMMIRSFSTIKTKQTLHKMVRTKKHRDLKRVISRKKSKKLLKVEDKIS